MTSGLLGGVAACNSPTGRATVLLEERIAVGDHGCQVVIWLDPHRAEPTPDAHQFGG